MHKGEALCSGLWHRSCELSTAQGLSPEQSRNNFTDRPGIKRPPKAERRETQATKGTLPSKKELGRLVDLQGWAGPTFLDGPRTHSLTPGRSGGCGELQARVEDFQLGRRLET